MTGGRVVVLGPTGRNFGAGMSGGIAFVHDPHETFGALVNGEMVALQELTDADRQWLHETIERHATFTDSPVAQRMLDDWGDAAAQFKRVMPIDYQRVLHVMAQAEADGLSESATLDRVMEASRG
jgi:glutamate synthase (NADPH/NADH) large chain